MHNAVMAEFGDSHAGDGVGTGASREEAMAVDPDLLAEATRDDIELVETSLPQEADIALEVW
jgi:hypothetical protein